MEVNIIDTKTASITVKFEFKKHKSDFIRNPWVILELENNLIQKYNGVFSLITLTDDDSLIPKHDNHLIINPFKNK